MELEIIKNKNNEIGVFRKICAPSMSGNHLISYYVKNGLHKESYMKDLKTLCKHELTEIELEEYNLIKRNINNEINNKF